MNTHSRIFKLCVVTLIALLTVSPGHVRSASSNANPSGLPARLEAAVKNALGADANVIPQNTPLEQAKLLASDKATNDNFGYAVALNSSGSIALIGAYNEDDSGTTENGAAYIFTRSGGVWNQDAKLLASDKASSDSFGVSVALSKNGNTALIGAYNEDDSGTTDNGAVYVFVLTGGVWTQQAKLLASDKANSDNFGYVVSVSNDGNTALVGAQYEDDGVATENGAAYVFTRSGGIWTQQAKLLASDKATNDHFGFAVALSGDSNTALIGTYQEDDSGTTDNGAAYVFTRSGGIWTQQAKLLANDKANGDYFGAAVSLNNDGDTALIGAPSEDDSGTTDNGATYIFFRFGSSWSQQAKTLAGDKANNDNFGVSVALGGSGDTAVIGAHSEDDSGTTDNGAAYTFARSGSSWSQQAKLLASDKATSDLFGISVALSGDSYTIAIGAVSEDDSGTFNNGAAYIYFSIPPLPLPIHGIGCYDTTTYTFYLRNALTTGSPDFTIAGYGSVAGDVPIVGDWNNDGIDTIGIFRRTTGEFFLRDSNTLGAPNYTLVLGNPDDTPLHGRWDNTMSGDGVGVFRPSNGIIYLRKTLTTGIADYFMIMGNPSDIGMAGDWDGDFIDSPGIYRVDEGKFYLTNSVTNGIVFASNIFAYGSGTSGAANPYVDIPVPGDWDGNNSVTAGVYNTQTGTFYLRNANSVGAANIFFPFCSPGTLPVAGHWSN